MAGEIEPIEYYENPVSTKNGEERIIALHNTILTDDEGKISGTLSSGEDITERKRAEEVLIGDKSTGGMEHWSVEYKSANQSDLYSFTIVSCRRQTRFIFFTSPLL